MTASVLNAAWQLLGVLFLGGIVGWVARGFEEQARPERPPLPRHLRAPRSHVRPRRDPYDDRKAPDDL